MRNRLLEEEVRIIEIFCYEMNNYGHNGYYSFYDNINNGYFIYKEDNKWVCNYNENGVTISTKKYTNIYNLCLSILFELQIDTFYFVRTDLMIPRGTKVIITKSSDCPVDEIRKGVIVDSKIDYSNSQPEKIYKVLGDDGNIYTGLYGLKIYDDIYFRTYEDFIENTKEQIIENTSMVQELHDINWNLYLTLNDVTSEKDKYLGEDSSKKSK